MGCETILTTEANDQTTAEVFLNGRAHEFKRVNFTTKRLKVLDLNGLRMNDRSREQGSCRHGLHGSQIKQSIET